MRSWAKTVLVALLVSQVGCGTLLYPERRQQRPTGQVDFGVVAMDAAWMLVFVVPGVAALAVDFATGAIYLPSGQRQFFDRRARTPGPVLTVRRGGVLQVATPAAPSDGTRWRLELRQSMGPEVLGSWSGLALSDIEVTIPPSLAPGAYDLRVIRDGTPVGQLAVRVRG